jgi:hypothetical protein
MKEISSNTQCHENIEKRSPIVPDTVYTLEGDRPCDLTTSPECSVK